VSSSSAIDHKDNLKSLGVDQIPVVNLRRTDNGPGLKAEGDQVIDS
jgi:hypothetical protein